MTIYGWLFNFFPNKWSTGVSKVKQNMNWDDHGNKRRDFKVSANIKRQTREQGWEVRKEGSTDDRKKDTDRGRGGVDEKKNEYSCTRRTPFVLSTWWENQNTFPVHWNLCLKNSNFQEFSYQLSVWRPLSVWAIKAGNIWYLTTPAWLISSVDYSRVKNKLFYDSGSIPHLPYHFPSTLTHC